MTIVNAILVFGLVLALALGGGAYLVFGRGVNLESVGPVIFAVIGIAALGLGLAFLWDSYRFVKQAASARGEVAALTLDESNMLFPVVHFTTARGETAEFTGPGSSPPAYARGDFVEVLYLPAEPKNARLNSFAQLWLAAVIFSGISLVFTGIAFISGRQAGDKCLKVGGAGPLD